MGVKVLVVDDEKLIVKGIKFALEQDGMEVECAYDGAEALGLLKKNIYDCVILDVMLPVYTGFEVCVRVRDNSGVPIIMLTARGDDEDKILGLDCGADDYITKPFNINELKARIKALLRRVEMSEKNVINRVNKSDLVIGDLRLEISNKRLFIKDNEVRITLKEFELLELLARNPGKVYSREQLLELIWNVTYPGDLRAVDVHVRRLREKLEEKPSEPKYVQTKWGVGYFFQG